MRHTHEWTDAELDFLAAHYALRGTAFIRAKYPNLTIDGIRQMATRLSLSDDLREYRPAAEIAKEAGTEGRALIAWINRRPWAARHLRTWGRETLVPAPVERLYLHAHRRPSRPRGWITVQQAAQSMAVTPRTVHAACQTGSIECVEARGAIYVDPLSLPRPRITRPPPNALTFAALSAASGEYATTIHRKVQAAGTVHNPAGGRPGRYTTADHARQFLTARGHHAEQVETIIRRAIALSVTSDMKESK